MKNYSSKTQLHIIVLCEVIKSSCHEDICGSECIAPHIRKLSTRWMLSGQLPILAVLPPQNMHPLVLARYETHWAPKSQSGCCAGQKNACPRWKSNSRFFGHQTCNLLPFQLSYLVCSCITRTLLFTNQVETLPWIILLLKSYAEGRISIYILHVSRWAQRCWPVV
jgi:hypothetical protein